MVWDIVLNFISGKFLDEVYGNSKEFLSKNKKKILFWLTNKKFMLKFKTVRHYTAKSYKDISEIFKDIQSLNKCGDFTYGKNYVQVLYDNFQAPIRVKIVESIPDVDIVSQQTEKEGFDVVIEFLGKLKCGYRGDKETRMYLSTVEQITKIVDKLFESKSDYDNNTVSLLDIGVEPNWKELKLIENKPLGISARIGQGIVQLNSNSFTSNLTIFKDYVLFLS